jgi:hypothetical protein
MFGQVLFGANLFESSGSEVLLAPLQRTLIVPYEDRKRLVDLESRFLIVVGEDGELC